MKAHLKLALVTVLGAFFSYIVPMIGPVLVGLPPPDWRLKLAAAITGALTAGVPYILQSPYNGTAPGSAPNAALPPTDIKNS